MVRLDKLALWYQINSVTYLGPVRFRELWRTFGNDVGVIFRMTDDELLKLKGVVTTQNLPFIRKQQKEYKSSKDFMASQLELEHKCGGRIVTLDEPDYPEFLRESKMCHPIIYCVGQLDKFIKFDKSIAIVGTRKAVKKSLNFAFETAESLAENGWVIVSGMAEGIDSEAHRGALKSGGKSIAVLGSGPDVVYPKRAQILYDDMKSRGLIISEFPFGNKPEGWRLKKRNKTTVALSLGALIVETGVKGGTMNAVKACKEQKKPVFTILPKWEGEFSGNRKIANEGAVVLKAPAIHIPEEISEALNIRP